MKHILIAGLILSLLCGIGNAGTWTYTASGGTGDCDTSCSGYDGNQWGLGLVGGTTYHAYCSIQSSFDNAGCPYCNGTYPSLGSSTHAHTLGYGTGAKIKSSSGSGSLAASYDINPAIDETLTIYVRYVHSTGYCCRGSCSGTVIISNETTYNVSGITNCIEETIIYLYSGGDYHYLNSSTDDLYKFDIYDGLSYRVSFDGNNYDFTCDDNKIKNYDGCSHTQYKLEDSCGNLIPDSEGIYVEWLSDSWLAVTPFYTSSGILDISNSSATAITIETDTFVGKTRWGIDPVVSGTTYTLENPKISWGLKVIVQNESDSTLLDDAMVKVDQTCYCTSGYSTRQKLTVNGMVEFFDMSLQDASLLVMKSEYKNLDENSTGYSAYLSGRSNFSSKTWLVKLAPTSSENVSSFYEINNTVDIHFVDVNSNRTSQILDTDAEVYIYYENNNTEEEAMTLKFQSSSTHTYFSDEQSWTIAHEDIGHKIVDNSKFTPYTYSYRAVIYNSSIYGWNKTIPLTVRNATKETTLHYQNLTTNLWFMYANDGKIDYRNDMKVAIHAQSNNTTLMDIDVELWTNGVYTAHVNLSWVEFAGADYPYYYMWNPIFDYESGKNYSVRMFGFDRTVLETDYVECLTDDTTRKNKLTIAVKDRTGATLANCYIYLEGWGSLQTGTTYYNAYEGINNGDYRYKATKSGYTGDGWLDVNITDEDKIVWYILAEDYSATSAAPTKFTDDDIKGFFFPLMFFLFICIVLGGLKYVAS